MHRQLIVWCLLLITTALYAEPTQHVVWDKTPIRITLPLNEERLIRFPLAIIIVDSELDDEIAGVMKAQDSLYLNAHKAFTNKRLVVQLMPFGEAIILNVTASADATNITPLEVVMADNPHEEDKRDAPPDDTSTTRGAQDATLNPISLTRFAIQSLFSPARLLVNPEGVSRTPMRTHRNITLLYGASVTANPLISWQAADLYVTAVQLKNQLNKRVILNPNMLLGDWQTATFYPTNTLDRRGQNDTTTVFVTSNKPFGEALAGNREFVR